MQSIIHTVYCPQLRPFTQVMDVKFSNFTFFKVISGIVGTVKFVFPFFSLPFSSAFVLQLLRSHHFPSNLWHCWNRGIPTSPPPLLLNGAFMISHYSYSDLTIFKTTHGTAGREILVFDFSFFLSGTFMIAQ